jgi:hypothetical protein
MVAKVLIKEMYRLKQNGDGRKSLSSHSKISTTHIANMERGNFSGTPTEIAIGK